MGEHEVHRLLQEAKCEGEELERKKAEAEEIWKQRFLKAEAELKAAREELVQERAQKQCAEALKEHEVHRLLQEAKCEGEELERKKAEADEIWKQRLLKAEAELKAAREELVQERAEKQCAEALKQHEINRLLQETKCEREEL